MASVQKEQGEQHSHPEAADLDRLAVAPDSERPQDAKPHRSIVDSLDRAAGRPAGY